MEPMAILWICAVVVFVAIEAITVQLVCIWFAASALVTMAATLLGAPMWLQFTLFPVCTAVLLIFTRPMAKRLFRAPVMRTNADRILGMPAVVISEVNNKNSEGQIKVMNQIWTARSLSGETLSEGTNVVVKYIEGVKALVDKIQ